MGSNIIVCNTEDFDYVLARLALHTAHCVSKCMPHVYTESASFIGSFGGKIGINWKCHISYLNFFCCLFDFSGKRRACGGNGPVFLVSQILVK